MIASRRGLLLGAASAWVLAACQGGGAANMGEDASDMSIGAENAPVRIVEYASLTCPHCEAFHAQVWDKLKADYIDTGKVRFTFREFTTHPQEVALAGFQLARCAANGDANRYFAMIDVLFDQQRAIFAAMEQQQARNQLLTIAQTAGLSEEQFNTCISDPTGTTRVDATMKKGADQLGVTGTPTIYINGVKQGADAQTYEGLAKAIDAQLNG